MNDFEETRLIAGEIKKKIKELKSILYIYMETSETCWLRLVRIPRL